MAELAVFSAPSVWQLFSMSGPAGTFVNPQARRAALVPWQPNRVATRQPLVC